MICNQAHPYLSLVFDGPPEIRPMQTFIHVLKWVYVFVSIRRPPSHKTTVSLPKYPPPFSRCGWHLCAHRGKREGWGCGLLTPTRQFAFPETLPFQSSNSIGRLSHFAKSFMQEFPLVSQQWSSWLPLATSSKC